jgi:hypothetical protein
MFQEIFVHLEIMHQDQHEFFKNMDLFFTFFIMVL